MAVIRLLQILSRHRCREPGEKIPGIWVHRADPSALMVDQADRHLSPLATLWILTLHEGLGEQV